MEEEETEPAELKADREPTTLESYALLAERADWSDADIYRAIVCNLPRRLHALNRHLWW